MVQTIRGLKTQEEDKFIEFFEFVQNKAAQLGKTFFLECEDGNEGRVDGMVVCDLQGWLVPNDKAEVFEPIWESDKVDDRWTDFFCFATWNNRSGLQIAFET